jgi:hypothetical protein
MHFPYGCISIISHERPVGRSGQKSIVYQRAEDFVARYLIQPPQPTRLLRRETKTRHFEILAANAANDLMNSAVSLSHEPLDFE